MAFKQYDNYEQQINALDKRFGEQNTFARLKREIESQSAFCVTTNDFCFVLRPVLDEHRQRGVFIALGIHNNPDCSVSDFSKIESMAKDSGMTFMRFRSYRKGFQRMAIKHGFYVESTSNGAVYYRKEV